MLKFLLLFIIFEPLAGVYLRIDLISDFSVIMHAYMCHGSFVLIGLFPQLVFDL